MNFTQFISDHFSIVYPCKDQANITFVFWDSHSVVSTLQNSGETTALTRTYVSTSSPGGAKNSLKAYNQMLFNILKSNTIQNGYFTQHYINNMNTVLLYGGTFKYRLTKIPVLFSFKLLY